MALMDPNALVTEQDLSDFYQGILPFLGGKNVESDDVIYGMHIVNNESVPSAKVVYINDAIGMVPASMNFTTGVFDYGSWGDAFFMPKPCMLKYDGTVDYYLDPNDYSKKEDGTASDVANTSYAGNAMMEWGQNGKKIWLKFVPNSSSNNLNGDIYIASYQADENFHDWSFHNSLGESVDHFYTPIYNGSVIDGKFRSLSGQKVSKSLTCDQMEAYAEANNPTGSNIWSLETNADALLINMLLMLISRTTNSQAAFGKGLCTSGSESTLDSFRTGAQDNKGLFYGTNNATATSSANTVKVFGMENWWGFQLRTLLGLITVNNTTSGLRMKMTYGTEDGSTTTGYNFTGEGYIEGTLYSPSGGWIGKMIFNQYGMYPTSSGGGTTIYYCDVFYIANYVAVARKGGHMSSGSDECGMFYYMFSTGSAPSSTYWYVGGAVSARPLS